MTPFSLQPLRRFSGLCHNEHSETIFNNTDVIHTKMQKSQSLNQLKLSHSVTFTGSAGGGAVLVVGGVFREEVW